MGSPVLPEEPIARGYQRGVIRSREYASQLRNFMHLRWGNITPTDIDLFLDFQNRLFIFVESKYSGAELRTGQRIAIERLCDACSSQTRTSIAMVCNHTAPAGTDIDFSGVSVMRYRLNRHWWTPKRPITLLPAIEQCRKRYL